MVDLRRRPAGSRPAGDRGHLAVVEAVLITVFLLGAITFVLTYQLPNHDGSAERTNLELIATDALTVLAGFPACDDKTGTQRDACLDHYGTSALVRHVTEAAHGDDAPIMRKLDRYLPEGAEYNLYLDNGRDLITLVETGVAGRQRTTVSRPFPPEWSMGFAVSDFNCYDPAATDLRAHVLPVHLSRVLPHAPSPAQMEFDTGHVAALQTAGTTGFHEAWVPPDDGTGNGYAREADGYATLNVTYHHRAFAGNLTYRGDGDGCTGVTAGWPALRDAHNRSTLVLQEPDDRSDTWSPGRDVTPGDTIRFDVDFTPWVTDLSAKVHDVRVHVYAPVPPRSDTPGYVQVHETVLEDAAQGTVEWETPTTSYLGAHLVVASVNATVPGTPTPITLEGRLVDHVNVQLPGGGTALNPVYRLILEVWFPDWS